MRRTQIDHTKSGSGSARSAGSEESYASAIAPLIANLDYAWGNDGTWHAYGAFPNKAERRETPFNIRKFHLKPAGMETWEPLSRRCGLAAVNTKGCKGQGDCALGQDNCSIARLSRNWEAVCVMDGHGPDGEFPATRAVQTLPLFLDKDPQCVEMLNQYNVAGALTRGFLMTQEDMTILAEKERRDLDFSGCTAVCVLRCLERKSVWIGWTGDSRAILIVPGKGVVQATPDHNLKVEAERLRLEASGCEICDEEIGGGVIISRLYVTGEEFPGLTMGRALGDNYMKDYGVLAEPEVVHWSLEGLQDPLLLAASDGVWEFLTSEDVADIVLTAIKGGQSLDSALHIVLRKAKEKWAEEGDYCDDITAVLVPLGGQFTVPLEKPSDSDTAIISPQEVVDSNSKTSAQPCGMNCKGGCTVS
eukprot:TRINITY_DN75877_c0_g1_i1.p1 TRINITY_DN75877_c0_g1~~TRINITY_DN75877_c0_g1_i1.p1  ORF type:complete len:418 (-),score=80.35 TRINITY_DN75877_c0_g1_i1:234-1487(-)